jgi:hypothetical protein
MTGCTYLEGGVELGEFLLPVVDRRQRRDNQERAPDPIVLRGVESY